MPRRIWGSESPSYRPPFYRDANSGGTKHGTASYNYQPAKEYENAATDYAYAHEEGQKEPYTGYRGDYGDEEEQWVPQSAEAPEYDWMT